MGKGYLIDSNILIYYFHGHLEDVIKNKIELMFNESFNISFISQIEFLGWKEHSLEGFEIAEAFISGARIIHSDALISKRAIAIKRKNSVKLPDAVIAATAIENEYTLVTRNESDFKSIADLKLYNPFKE